MGFNILLPARRRKSMNKTPLISIREFQQSLLDKGIAIAAACSHESYGEIIFNQIVTNPLCNLETTVRVKALEALSDKFRSANQVMQKHHNMSDEDYLTKLLEDLESEQEYRQSIKDSELEWVDSDNPRNGIMARVTKNLWSYFELKVSPQVLISMRETISNIEFDKSIKKKIQEGIEYLLEDWDIDVDDVDDSRSIDWSDMVTLDTLIEYSQIPKKHHKNVLDQLHRHLGVVATNLLSPIIDNYKSHLLYETAEDTSYFSIGGPTFFLIIAGERSEGSHEITIFEACNE